MGVLREREGEREREREREREVCGTEDERGLNKQNHGKSIEIS